MQCRHEEYSQFAPDLTGRGTIGYFRGFENRPIMMKSASPKPPASFEAALQELERLVQTLESGGVPLEDSLKAYERGMMLLKHCQETLAQAEQKIRILDGDKLSDFSASPENSDEGGAD
jgi:exodeoxyribonuclease VII small subunit